MIDEGMRQMIRKLMRIEGIRWVGLYDGEVGICANIFEEGEPIKKEMRKLAEENSWIEMVSEDCIKVGIYKKEKLEYLYDRFKKVIRDARIIIE